ncbi:hypothetical protein J437_LFUL003600 [Ladona fulva]|uniref:EGF-like domain-containing protein n=1 Tax=Ladona fulva TaxID=123851 RepID=A0A8K0KJC8_LADFU|nr:hypothetical protein J437_LFUL003600 [Ladona fulva]
MDVETFSFRQKRQAVNPCSQFINPCFRRGICIPTGATSFRCECHSNLYKGEKCKYEVKHCESSPCENGGTCEEAQGTYLCDCPPSYQGINCEIEKTGVNRISKPFLLYEVDILVTYIQKYVIAFASLGSNLKIDVSTGDGFSLTIQGKHFTKVVSVKEWLKSKNIHGRLKNDKENGKD